MARIVSSFIVLAWILALAVSAGAQEVIDETMEVSFDRPEAWGMKYFASLALPGGFAAPRRLDAGRLELGIELGQLPHLDAEERRLGFEGMKVEDLNRFPLLLRPRLGIGIPAGFSLVVGWVPPLEIEGLRANLWSLGVERPVIERDAWRLGLRLQGLDGTIKGDITCSAHDASFPPGSEENLYGCLAPSDDAFDLFALGLETSASFDLWRRAALNLGVAATHMDVEMQVDARTFGVVDQTRLLSDGWVYALRAGVTIAWGPEGLASPTTLGMASSSSTRRSTSPARKQRRRTSRSSTYACSFSTASVAASKPGAIGASAQVSVLAPLRVALHQPDRVIGAHQPPERVLFEQQRVAQRQMFALLQAFLDQRHRERRERGKLLSQVHRLALERFFRHDAMHHAATFGGTGVDDLTAEDQIEGVAEADQPRQPLRAAGSREDSQPHFRQTERGASRQIAEVAGERQLQTSAQSHAVDGGDHRLRQTLDLEVSAMRHVQLAAGEQSSVGAHRERCFGELANVIMLNEETGHPAGQNHGADLTMPLDTVEQVVELRHHARVHQVARRVVEPRQQNRATNGCADHFVRSIQFDRPFPVRHRELSLFVFRATITQALASDFAMTGASFTPCLGAADCAAMEPRQ
jgi:hypothetical protein